MWMELDEFVYRQLRQTPIADRAHGVAKLGMLHLHAILWAEPISAKVHGLLLVDWRRRFTAQGDERPLHVNRQLHVTSSAGHLFAHLLHLISTLRAVHIDNGIGCCHLPLNAGWVGQDRVDAQRRR
jgi:hypothetical protein